MTVYHGRPSLCSQVTEISEKGCQVRVTFSPQRDWLGYIEGEQTCLEATHSPRTKLVTLC